MSDEKQGSLDKAWEVVNDAKARRKGEHYDWVSILGMSVTNYVRKYKSMDVFDIYFQILDEHLDLTDDMKDKLKIDVSASYTYVGEKRRGKRGRLKWERKGDNHG
jgi:hypothetical protein